MCLFLVKTAVFQPEILINHHGNHFHGFMALVEEKNQNPLKVTYFTKYYQVATYHSKLKFWSFHLKLNGLWQALLNHSQYVCDVLLLFETDQKNQSLPIFFF